jgi:hypothetical protein
MADDNLQLQNYQDDLDTDPNKTDKATETDDLANQVGMPPNELAKEFKVLDIDQAERDANPTGDEDRYMSPEDAREYIEDLDENDEVGSNQP